MSKRVAELDSTDLDFWVGQAEGLQTYILDGRCRLMIEDGGPPYPIDYCPSADWSQGGPLIEREGIWLSDHDGRWIASLPPHVYVDNGSFLIQEGPTPLVAAMRALVARKLGATVGEGA